MIEHGYWGPISPNYVGLVHHLQVAALQEVVGDKYHPNEVFCSPVTTVKRAMIITQMSFLFNFFRQFQLATRGLQFQICRRYATEEFMRSLFPSASELKLSLLYPILKLAAVDRSNEVQRLGSHGWD